MSKISAANVVASPREHIEVQTNPNLGPKKMCAVKLLDVYLL